MTTMMAPVHPFSQFVYIICFLFHPPFRALIVTSCHRPTVRRRTPSPSSLLMRPERIFTVHKRCVRVYSTRDLHTMRTGLVAAYCIRSAALQCRVHTECLLCVRRPAVYSCCRYRAAMRVLVYDKPRETVLEYTISFIFMRDKYILILDRSVYERTHTWHTCVYDISRHFCTCRTCDTRIIYIIYGLGTHARACT